VIGVERWAEMRRLYFVEHRSKRAIHRLTGVHRDTITRALISDQPPRYERLPPGSKLDPFKDWICDQLREDPSIPSLRLREMATEFGYSGGKSIFDDFVREVRPRFRSSVRSSARCIGRGSWCSVICGSRASRLRWGMGSCVAAGW
jgi:transposase